MSFLLSLCIHQSKTLLKRLFDFDAWFLPGLLPMGGTDGKVQNSPGINKCHDFWACMVLRWPLHLKMRIYLIFSLPLQYHNQVHADGLILKSQLFPAPHFSQKELFPCLSAQPSLLPPPIFCSLLPQMPSCCSQFSFACQFLLPRQKFSSNPAAGRQSPWGDLLFRKLCPQRGGNQAKFLWKTPSILSP